MDNVREANSQGRGQGWGRGRNGRARGRPQRRLRRGPVCIDREGLQTEPAEENGPAAEVPT
jgi:hypothetical protein